jgi:CHASE3 domain sensor protein
MRKFAHRLQSGLATWQTVLVVGGAIIIILVIFLLLGHPIKVQ